MEEMQVTNPKHPPQTNNTTMTSAAQTVFATAELLEQILLQLPVRSLTRSRAVQKRWQETVADSPQLRERVQFRSPTSEVVHDEWMPTYTLNPRLLQIKARPKENATGYRAYYREAVRHIITIDHQALLDLPSSSLQELISQPPRTEALVCLAWDISGGFSEIWNIPITSRDGITLATLKQYLLTNVEDMRASHSGEDIELADACVGLLSKPDIHKSTATSLKSQYGSLP